MNLLRRGPRALPGSPGCRGWPGRPTSDQRWWEVTVPAKPISHIEHQVPGTAVWRPGSPATRRAAPICGTTCAPLEQVHNSCLHGSGVVEGFTVSASHRQRLRDGDPGRRRRPHRTTHRARPRRPAETADDPATSSTLVTVPASGSNCPSPDTAATSWSPLQWHETFVDPPTSPGRHLRHPAHPVAAHRPGGRGPAADRLVLATLVLSADGTVAPDGLRDDRADGPVPHHRRARHTRRNRRSAEPTAPRPSARPPSRGWPADPTAASTSGSPATPARRRSR